MSSYTRIRQLVNRIVTRFANWLRRWHWVLQIVCYFTCFFGLLLFAFSSYCNELFGGWIKWKILYFAFSIIFFVVVVYCGQKSLDCSISPLWEINATILVLLASCAYTHFWEKKVHAEPDGLIFGSCVAFTIMSLSLSLLSHIGFEVEFFYFFTCTLIIELMKIKWWWLFVGGFFMCLLVNLRSSLDDELKKGSRRGSRRESNALQTRDVDRDPSQNLHSQVSHYQLQGISSSQEVTGVMARFMRCIEALKKENNRVADKVFQSVKDNANLVDINLVMDSLPLEDLHESTQLMMKAGLEAKCLEDYTSWRREFLDMILSLFPSPDLKMEDIENGEKIEGWVQTLTIAVRIIFPNEITLCERVFGSDYFPYSALAEVCKESATRLIVSSYAVATWSHYKPDTLQQLLQELDTMFQLWPGKSSSLIVDQLNKVRFILDNFGYFKNTLSNNTAADGIHPITRQVMNYIDDEFKKKDDSFVGRCFEEYATAAKQGKLTSSPLVERIIELLESSLEATSKSYKTPSLGYVFIMINRTFIASEIKRLGLEHIIGHHWVQGNQQKIDQNIRLYLDSSWKHILDILKVDYLGPDDYGRDSMEDKLSSFIENFDEICKDKSMWFVSDDNLRNKIVDSIKENLLPENKKFIERFYKLLPWTSYRVIKPEPQDVDDRLNNLFLERAEESDAGREGKKDV